MQAGLFSLFKAIVLFAIFITVAACSSDGDSDTDRDANASATYKVTFTTVWTGINFPIMFPGGAHFSGLIGGTHNEQIKFWETGQMATDGIESMAETGSKSGLSSEVNAAIADGRAEFELSGGGNSNAGMVELEFDINETYPLVTLVSMVAPSPDWFVGVRDLLLLLFDTAAGDWMDTVTVDLKVYDAGTDSGVTFTASNADTQPADPIALLTSVSTDTDFTNGVGPDIGSGERFIATMTFTRIK